MLTYSCVPNCRGWGGGGGDGGVIFLFFETFLLFNRTFALGFFSEYKCSFSEWNLDSNPVARLFLLGGGGGQNNFFVIFIITCVCYICSISLRPPMVWGPKGKILDSDVPYFAGKDPPESIFSKQGPCK